MEVGGDIARTFGPRRLESFAPKSASSGDPNDKTYDKVCNILEKDLRQVCTSLRLQINLSFYLAFAPSAMHTANGPSEAGFRPSPGPPHFLIRGAVRLTCGPNPDRCPSPIP